MLWDYVIVYLFRLMIGLLIDVVGVGDSRLKGGSGEGVLGVWWSWGLPWGRREEMGGSGAN